jgi:hypothetical protein
MKSGDTVKEAVMKIEEGKYYIDGNGYTCGPMVPSLETNHPWHDQNQDLYTDSGVCGDDGWAPDNLLRERAPTNPKTITMEIAGAKSARLEGNTLYIEMA